MIIIYNYYMLQPDTSLSRFANQPNRVWLTWARHLAVSHLQVSAVNIKANFAMQLNQTSIQQPEAHGSLLTAEPAVIYAPFLSYKVNCSELQFFFRISELHQSSWMMLLELHYDKLVKSSLFMCHSPRWVERGLGDADAMSFRSCNGVSCLTTSSIDGRDLLSRVRQ